MSATRPADLQGQVFSVPVHSRFHGFQIKGSQVTCYGKKTMTSIKDLPYSNAGSATDDHKMRRDSSQVAQVARTTMPPNNAPNNGFKVPAPVHKARA